MVELFGFQERAHFLPRHDYVLFCFDVLILFDITVRKTQPAIFQQGLLFGNWDFGTWNARLRAFSLRNHLGTYLRCYGARVSQTPGFQANERIATAA